MKRINRKIIKKVLRKCPYLLLVLFTSCVAVLFSDKIGIKAVKADVVSAWNAEEESPPETVDAASGPALDKQTASLQAAAEQGREVEGTWQENTGNVQAADPNLNADLAGGGGSESEAAENADSEEQETVGVTKFEYYTPVEVESGYYTDAGKIALTTEYPYETVDESYFDDAAFIGDSRTLGLSDYLGFEQADFFCENSMTVYKLLEDTGVTYQKTGEKVDLKQMMQEKTYGKIYMMLGINEYGYANTEYFLEQYQLVVEQLRSWQPDAVIYLMANLHISAEKNDIKTGFDNININAKNAAVASLANGTDIFYLDANPLFTDEEGFLKADLTFDGVHLYAQHYDVWREFLMEHGVCK